MSRLSHENLMSCLKETVSFLKESTKLRPQKSLTLGSGLGKFVDEVTIEKSIPFHKIPHFSPPTVEGHSGNLVFAKLGNTELAILQGRNHFYEGHSMLSVTLPTRALALMGVQEFFLTNSAGGMGDGMKAGDFMVIDDHLNLTGENPLLGPNHAELGPRFPDMTEVYNSALKKKLMGAFDKCGVPFHKGIYAGLTGPTYETPAEVRYLKMIGASAVGMSTVSEAIVARHMGRKVVGLSCITNLAAGLSGNTLDHSEVTETAKAVESSFVGVLKSYFIS